MKRIRHVCKPFLAFLAVAMIPLVLMGCGNGDEQPSAEDPTEETPIETPEINDLSAIHHESDESVNDDIDRLIKDIEEYGIFSRPAPVRPSIQEALLKSEEYKKGAELHVLAIGHQKNNETEEADRNYRIAAKHFLKAAAQHLEADISECTFRAGLSLNNLNQPDSERAYLLLKYTAVITPREGMPAFCNAVINDIRKRNLLSEEKMRELDERVDKMQSVVR